MVYLSQNMLENVNNQSINLFHFPEIHLQGCYHMDMEIVKNIIQIQAIWLKIMSNTIYKNKIQVVVFACNEYNLISVVKNCLI